MMTKAQHRPTLTTRTLHIGSSLAAGAMMMSRLNRSEISRYDDLLADLSRIRTPAHRPTPPQPAERDRPVPQRKRWMTWISR